MICAKRTMTTMHPRNIYKESARAIRHAEKDPYVSQFLIEEKGKKRFGSLDDKALRQLSKILLKEDFNLDIDFPPLALVPTIPLRLNYILWLEDLISDFVPCSFRENDSTNAADSSNPTGTTRGGPIHGIDIGTGGSAIYAVLAARKNYWKMIGTETNPDSFAYAKENVSRNHLDSNVAVLQASPTNFLGQIFVKEPETVFHFSMCNPPFFGSPEETESLLNSRTDHRPPPSNEKTGAGNELFVEGGEIKFVSDMIMESISFKSKVRIFTTMVGVKAHLPMFVKLLKQEQVPNITTTEFVQGRTRRWGLAWSFYHNYKVSHRNSVPGKLTNLWISGVPNPPKPMHATISIENGSSALQSVIEAMFKDLKLQLVHSKQSNGTHELETELEYFGFENNWSNMRRRRREQARRGADAAQPGEEPSTSPKQPKTAEEFPSERNENLAQKSNQIEQSGSNSLRIYESCDCALALVHFSIILRPRSLEAEVTFVHIEGTLGPEGMHQVFQYMKNCLHKHEKVKSIILSH